ncbi:hypothetical protein E3U43_005314 [Larimichthys crocea]|uniref:Uncharacterized protein n=1 Tax=Larimichthys crocea TaxID=215358 RepID=A0ACD3QHL5_LARCR|nr:hypothetical protein E3U43_005314 [Larimichthys crocea]
MSERHRALPPWMAKKEKKAKGKEPLKSRRKPKTARAAFYCMNEKELVEAAASFLTSSACEDAVLRTGQKVVLFLSFFKLQTPLLITLQLNYRYFIDPERNSSIQ